MTDAQPPAAAPRTLVHGPVLEDLTDLLFFDRLVYPTVKPRLLSAGRPYPAREALGDALRERLTDAGRLVVSGALVLPSADALNASLLAGGDALAASARESGRILGEIALAGCLEVPATPAQRAQWLREIDGAVARLARMAAERGHRATARYHAEDVTATLAPGWDPVLGITFAGVPRIDAREQTLGAVVGFLGDPETERWRRRITDWPSLLGSDGAEAGAAAITERLGELLQGYRAWVRRSGLASRAVPREFLVACDPALIEALGGVDQTAAAARGLFLARRGLALGSEREDTSVRELAYVAHVRRHVDAWWPGFGAGP